MTMQEIRDAAAPTTIPLTRTGEIAGVPSKVEGRARVGDVELQYEIVGTGEPVLLLHGLGSSSADWAPQIAELARDFRVIAVDLRGHGRSDKPAGPYSIAGFAADVAAVLARLGVGEAHVCGISLGGMVAFQLAVDHPALVRTLAIINSGPAFPGHTLKGWLALQARLWIIRMKGLPALGPVIARRLFPKPEQEPLRTAFVEQFATNDRAAYESTLRAIGNFDVSDRLDGIRCPILVLAGDRDYTPLSAKEAYMPRLRDARLVVIRDSGHASPMDQPFEVNEALAEFWMCR